MLWIGCDRGDGRRRRKNCSVAALSKSIFITNTFISSLMILLHILQPSVVALQNHNSESLLQSSTLIYQTNNHHQGQHTEQHQGQHQGQN